MNLNGKTIMVTGAGQGLGQKMAEMIAGKGGRLALVDVSEEQLQAAIAPGFCNTRMVANMSPKVLEKLKARIPLKRLGEPSEIGHSVIYILENDYFNGRVLEVDGGLRL